MNLFHLWFIKYDTLFFNDLPNFLQLRKMIRNHYIELSQCNQTNIQLHLYELIKFIDYFFNLQNIVELLQYHIEEFTQEQFYNIEQKIIQFRIIIECQKIYCEEFWLNKKLNWDVEVRILSSICRIYLFIVKVHHFLVGQNKTLWQISKLNKLFIPIEHWEKFANQIYIKLLKMDKFYYEYHYPYLKQIHQLLTSFKTLLHNFPRLYCHEIQKSFALFQIILSENKKYVSNFKTKFFEQRKNYHKHYTNTKKLKTKSLQYQKSKIFQLEDYYIAFNFKLQRRYSLEKNFFNPASSQLSNIQKKFNPILRQSLHRRNKKLSNSSLKNSPSEYASTRDLATTTQEISESYISKQQSISNRSKQQSIVHPRIKAKTRRASFIHKRSGIKLLQRSLEKILIQFDLNFDQEKQQNKLSFRSFYDQLPYPNTNNHPIKISVGQELNPSRKLKYEGVASKQKLAQKKLKELLENSSFQLPKISLQKYNKKCT